MLQIMIQTGIDLIRWLAHSLLKHTQWCDPYLFIERHASSSHPPTDQYTHRFCLPHRAWSGRFHQVSKNQDPPFLQVGGCAGCLLPSFWGWVRLFLKQQISTHPVNTDGKTSKAAVIIIALFWCLGNTSICNQVSKKKFFFTFYIRSAA